MSVLPNVNSLFGKDFPRLSGKDNYVEWAKAFDPIARLNGVHDYYKSGSGGIAPMPKPSLDTVFPSDSKAQPQKSSQVPDIKITDTNATALSFEQKLARYYSFRE